MSEHRLVKMRPEDDWADKFYAALAELWTAVKGTEIPALPTPPHIVMARLIEDVAWASRPAPQPLDAERLAEAMDQHALRDHDAYHMEGCGPQCAESILTHLESQEESDG